MAIFSGNTPAAPATYEPTADSNRFWLESPSLTQAEYLLNRGNRPNGDAALEYIEKGLQAARRHHNVRLQIQYMAVKAVALKCTGRMPQALDLLEKTLGMAQPRGLVRSIIDRGPRMAELLRTLSERQPEHSYVKTLLDAFGSKVASEDFTENVTKEAAPAKQPVDLSILGSLTNREIDVLLLLSERLTNKEIAQKLKISPITVKTHTANIYSKLSVSSRRKAVERALQSGLLTKFGLQKNPT